MVERTSDLQASPPFRTSEKADIDMVSIVLVIRGAGTIEFWPTGVAGPVLHNIVQAQPSGRHCARYGHSYRLGREQSAIIGKAHYKRTICGCLQPCAAVECSVVVANPGVIPAH